MSATDDVGAGNGEALLLTWPESDVALVTMFREREMNTLTLELLDELDQALTASVAGGARALIITGQGRAFCAGAHLRYFTEGDPRIGMGSFALRDRYLQRVAAVFDRIETLPIPVIAAINGFALGGGCEMSIACDFRLMADHARIGVPEVRIGALAGAGGVQKLHRLVGRGKALEWVLLGSHVTAAEALAHGLVTAIHPVADLMPAAMELASRFRLLGPRAVAQSKMAVRMCGDADLSTARNIGLEALAVLIGGPEWQEGMNAFMEKREPRFPAPSELESDQSVGPPTDDHPKLRKGR
jgi:enoyl-CoA hydratase/carnithine racemase